MMGWPRPRWVAVIIAQSEGKRPIEEPMDRMYWTRGAAEYEAQATAAMVNALGRRSRTTATYRVSRLGNPQ
jgi:hypothetical protein